MSRTKSKSTIQDIWKFSSIPAIEEATFNEVLEKFYDYGISGLVRENIQNSLDGKLSGENAPVIVTIKTGTVHRECLPGIEEIKGRIASLKGRNSYTRETIAHMQSKMDEVNIPYISFEDSNTKGLKGAKNTHVDSKEDTWSIYAYSKGIHIEEDDEELEKLRGGSRGVGKIASNAASDLHLMYFSNCDEEGNKHLGGNVQLIEHEYNEEFYRSTGYFTDLGLAKNALMRFFPYKNVYHEVFEKNTRGLKIIIPFIREQFRDEAEIIRSVCDSFFIAILNKKLQVNVNGKIINDETFESFMTDKLYFKEDINNIKKCFTPLYCRTLKNTEPKIITIADLDQEHKFKLYFNYDKNISKARVAIVRNIGMKIEDKKIKGNINKPFNAILIPATRNEDAFLKTLENEAHTEIVSEHIKNQNLQKNAKRFINNISKKISEILEEEEKIHN